MFNKKSAAVDIESEMNKNLVSNALEKTHSFNKIALAVDYLNSAAELLDDVGMEKQAEVLTVLLESLAKANKKKSKKQVKKPSKRQKSKKQPKQTQNPDTSHLSSERMVENLKEKGWVFDVDDLEYSDDDELCGDMNYADEADEDDDFNKIMKLLNESSEADHEEDNIMDFDFEDELDTDYRNLPARNKW